MVNQLSKRSPIESSALALTEPDLTGRELEYLKACLEGGAIAGDGAFTVRCRAWLERHYARPVLLTHSCTAALEMAAMLLVAPGDEVIMPSYTFVSTANAFVLRGANPVFVDIHEDTLNIDETKIEAAITSRTRVIVPVHYAGVACAMDEIESIATRRGLAVIEDAAQGFMAGYRDRALGTLGTLGALSFHQTKNVVSGEGGLLIINDPALVMRANVVREKGTNRTEFLRGIVDKYEWLDVGSSYLPSDLVAAVLLAQLEGARAITERRLHLWNLYHDAFTVLEQQGLVRRPIVPPEAQHNGHIYRLLFASKRQRDHVNEVLQSAGIGAATHYVPLHSAPAGRKYGRVVGSMEVTDRVTGTMLRLPLHGGLSDSDLERVVDLVTRAARS